MTAHMVEHGHQARPRTRRHHQPEPNPSSRRDSTPGTPRHDEAERMPLRTDLFLIAHDSDTGQPHLDKRSIAVGLAGAVLLELWHAGRLRLGWHGNPDQCTWERNHGDVTLLNATPTDDPIHDAAIGLLWRLGGTTNTQHFIEMFATINLYEAVRDHLTNLGILHRYHRRRFLFFRTEHRRPRSAVHPVKARARIRNVATLHRPRAKDTMLAALVTALNLTPFLHFLHHRHPRPTRRTHRTPTPHPPHHQNHRPLPPHIPITNRGGVATSE